MIDTKDILIAGDCVETLKQLPSKSVDCIVTSPPYWKGFAYEAYFNSYYQYLQWSEEWMLECKRVLTDDGTFWLNVANDSETTIRAYELMDIATKKLMYKLHDSVIWYRYNQQPANTTRQLTNQVEYVFCLRKSSFGIDFDKKSAYENAPEMFKTKNVGNVWELPFNSNKESSVFGRKELNAKWGHSGFPVKLPETCILLSTKKGQVVLDPFIGSGTTAVACIHTGRHYIGIDKEEDYIEYAKERIGKIGKDFQCRFQ